MFVSYFVNYSRGPFIIFCQKSIFFNKIGSNYFGLFLGVVSLDMKLSALDAFLQHPQP
jgi:hypothetical protein